MLLKLLFLLCFLTFYTLVRLQTILFRILRLSFFIKLIQRDKKVLYLNSIKNGASGHRYRTQKWVNAINQEGIQAKHIGVFDIETWNKCVNKENKTIFFIKYMFIRYFQILSTINYSTVIVTRELLIYNDYGNLFYEKLLQAIHPNTILDFDDDIGAAKKPIQNKSIYTTFLLHTENKFYKSFKYYNKFICGSEYLKKLLLEHEPEKRLDNIIVTPTLVDYTDLPAKIYPTEMETISFGWVGSTGNLRYLNIILPALEKLSHIYKIKLIVISGKDYVPASPVSFEIENIPWSLKHEVQNLLKIDIGLMPLENTIVDKGKCGFKLIQYMGLGIVSVATGVTINNEIIDHTKNGFIVPNSGKNQWYETLTLVLKSEEKWVRIASAARERIKAKYSFSAHKDNYVKFVTE